MYRYIQNAWPLTGIADDLIEWWDPDYQVVRTIPKPHRLWDVFQEWLAAGNTPLAPGEDWPS